MNNTTTTEATYPLSFSYKGERHTFDTCGCAIDINDSVHELMGVDWEDFDLVDAAERITARLLSKGAPCTTHDC